MIYNYSAEVLEESGRVDRDILVLAVRDISSVLPPLPRPPGIPVREFPGIADPKIPGRNSREFMKFWRELRGIYRRFVFFPIFIVDYDILVFNYVHDARQAYTGF